MRANFFKRALSFILDAYIVFGIIYLLFILIGRTVIQSGVPDYKEHERLYNLEKQRTEALYDTLDTSLSNNEITKVEHDARYDEYTTDFNNTVADYIVTQFQYFFFVSLFFFVNFAFINYLYNLAFKGRTLGRNIMHLRLDGNIKWYSLLTRELLYKGFFGLITLPIDTYLILFSNSKKAIRDRISGIYVVDESVKYPF